MTIYAERTLEADPKNYAAMLMIASGLAARTREFDLDKEEKLKRAEKFANEGIALAKAAPKPRPDLADADWDAAKGQYAAQGYEALGLAAMVRKKYDEAAKQFEQAIAISPDGGTYVRLANAYNQAKKPDQAIATLDKLNGVADVHPAVKQAAAAERNTAVKLKGGAAPAAPATTPAPAGGAATTPAAPTTPAPAPPATSPAK
jgi:tetratricopeptide (TPR) repeat protein